MYSATLLVNLLLPFLFLTSRVISQEIPSNDDASASDFLLGFSAVAPAFTSYASAHSTDADFNSIISYLATQTSIPKATIAFATGADFFPDQRLVPTNLISALPTTLRSYASAYASGLAAAGESAARALDKDNSRTTTAASAGLNALKGSHMSAASSISHSSDAAAGSGTIATGSLASVLQSAKTRGAATTSGSAVNASGMAVKGQQIDGLAMVFAGVITAYVGVLVVM